MRLFAVVSAAGLLAFAQQTRPPQQTQPVFRGGVDLVQVDVVVVDADGQPVKGLTKDDFTLFDRGIKQDIAVFAAKTHEHPPPAPFPAPLPADVADNRSAKSDRLVIIVLDDLHFRGRTLEAVHLVKRAVEELGDSVSLGLVTTSGTFGIEVTEDRAWLLAAVESFLDRYDPARAKMAPLTTEGVRNFGPPDLAALFGPLHAYRTMEDVARMMGANDGRRKTFIWISAGPPGGAHGNSNYRETCKDFSDYVKRTGRVPDAMDYNSMQICGMYEKLFRSSVTVYGVSPGGPLDGGKFGTLGDIAKDTGGFAVRASEMDAGMTRIISDLDNYYLLGFYPAEPGRAGFRTLEVTVNRPGLTVRHRVGYHAKGPVPPPTNDTPLGTLVAPITPKADLHLRMTATPFFSSGSSMQLVTTLEIDLGALPATEAGLVRDQLEFAIFAVDLKKKKVTQSAGRRVLVDWPPERRDQPGAERFLVQTVLNVPPGWYQLRASTMSRTPEKSGSVYLQVGVPPKASDSPIDLSGLLVGRTASSAGPRLVESKAIPGLTLPFAPSLDREFTTADTLRVFFQVARKQPKAAVRGEAVLLNADGVTIARQPWSVQPMAPGTVTMNMPLADVLPGAYRLVVSTPNSSGDATAAPVSREVRIRVR